MINLLHDAPRYFSTERKLIQKVGIRSRLVAVILLPDDVVRKPLELVCRRHLERFEDCG